jgi:1-deoxy-D-xylulose-5-phosphate synthase
MDTEMLEKYGRIAKVICTIEDHVLMGGFGSAVLESLEDLHIAIPVARVGYADKFMEHASSNKEIQDKYGLSSGLAVAKINELLAEAEKATGQTQKFRVLGAEHARTA